MSPLGKAQCVLWLLSMAISLSVAQCHDAALYSHDACRQHLDSVKHREVLTADASDQTCAIMEAEGCCLAENIHAPLTRKQDRHSVIQSWWCPYDAVLVSDSAQTGKRGEIPENVPEHVQHFETLATWNLDRIDTRTAIYDSRYTPFDLPTSPATPIHVYIVDTGLYPQHEAFRNVAVSLDYPSQEGAMDCNGHGTHVASIIAGYDTGIIAEAGHLILHIIRALDCAGSGTTTTVIRALAWIAANLQGDGIVNMSLGGGKSAILNNYVNTLYTDFGIVIITAAGNEEVDACERSPASAEYSIAVGATRLGDFRASYSNYGPCVNMFAPGSDVRGAHIGNPAAYLVRSGTSMAAPHVTGGLARLASLFLNTAGSASKDYLAHNDAVLEQLAPGESVTARIWQVLKARSTPNVVKDAGRLSYNRMLFLGDPNAPPPPPPQFPIAPPPNIIPPPPLPDTSLAAQRRSVNAVNHVILLVVLFII